MNPNMKNVSISIVTPALNEWSNIFEMSSSVVEVLRKYRDTSEWIIVSEPGVSHEILSSFRELSAQFRLVERPVSDTSFAMALQTGINSISGISDVIVTMDGDQSHNPLSIPELVDALNDDPKIDVAIASRYVLGGKTDNPPLLRIMSLILNGMFRVTMGMKARDLSTNFKAFRSHDLRNIELVSKNFEAVEELLKVVEIRKGRKPNLIEIPDTFYQRKHGESKRKLGQFIGSYLVSLIVMSYRVKRRHQRATSQSSR
jgi:dolichol-phosphate mannosyltransferase